MASITFTDALGTAILTNGESAPADRFASWQPRTIPVGRKRHAAASGRRHAYIHRDDFGATFELQGIPRTQMAIMDRLVRHLDAGGTVEVETDDAGTRTYAECGLAPGAEPPYPRLTDRVTLEYAMAFSLINVAAVPTPMLCIY